MTLRPRSRRRGAYASILPLVVGVMFFPVVLGSPDSSLSVALSLVPFWTPLLMFLRMTVVTPPAWQVALGLALTLLSIAGLTWVAARIYRVGINIQNFDNCFGQRH